MLTRYSASRCCCGEKVEPPQQPCPCLEDTLLLGNSITVTGFEPSIEPLPGVPYPSVDGTFITDTTSETTCSTSVLNTIRAEFGIVVSIYRIQFTRLENLIIEGQQQILPIELPVGVKAVISVSSVYRIAAPQDVPYSNVAFHKVLSDIDGYVDCTEAITGFTYNAENFPTSPIFGPERIFYASNGTVSYSP